jgi:hypothetical protein
MAWLGLSGRTTTSLIEAALMDPGWRPLAALDASTRMVAAVMRASGLRRGRQAARVLVRCFERARKEPAGERESIPTLTLTLSQKERGRKTYPSKEGGRGKTWPVL